MEDNILEIGLIIWCMEEEYILGMMGENMKDSIIWIKNKDLEYFHGLMAKNILVSGRMASNMEGENLLVREVMKKQDFGKMVKELDGLLMNCEKKKKLI